MRTSLTKDTKEHKEFFSDPPRLAPVVGVSSIEATTTQIELPFLVSLKSAAMTRVSTNWRLVLAALGLLLLGFIVGRYSAPDGRLGDDSSAGKSQTSRETREQPGPDDEARSSLATIRIEELSHIPPSELAEVFGHRRPAEIAALAKKFDSLPPNPTTYANLRPLFKTWAQFDEKTAFKAAVAFTDDRMREIAIETIASSASPEGAGRIAGLIREQPAGTFRDGVKEQLIRAALQNWSQTSPAAAAQFIIENPELRENSASEIMRNWGWIEGPAAIEWLKLHPNPNGYLAMTERSDAMLGWVENDPRAASTYIVNHLDDPHIRETVFSAASGLFYVDKTLALEWPVKLPAGEVQEIAVNEIARAYAESDPKGAIVWALRFQGKAGEQAFESVISKWTQTDAAAALEWIKSSAGSFRDQGLVTLSVSIVGNRPSKAIEAANLILDPAVRLRTVEEILSNVSSAPTQIALIDSSLLSAEQKANLRARVGKRETP